MKITWEVDDGYVCGSRPQTTEIDDYDLMSAETVEEAMKIIEDNIQEDFSQKITWWMQKDSQDLQEELKDMIKEFQEEED